MTLGNGHCQSHRRATAASSDNIGPRVPGNKLTTAPACVSWQKNCTLLHIGLLVLFLGPTTVSAISRPTTITFFHPVLFLRFIWQGISNSKHLLSSRSSGICSRPAAFIKFRRCMCFMPCGRLMNFHQCNGGLHENMK